MIKNIVFRADGNQQTGLGHLYRLTALAQTVVNGQEATLVTRSNSEYAFVSSHLNCRELPETLTLQDEANWLANEYSPSSWIIVADGYQFDIDYQRSIRDAGFSILFIDDLVRPTVANAVINHAINVSSTEFESATDTRFYLGPEYALVRSGFLEQAKHHREINGIQNLFVNFGGSDPLDLTCSVVRAARAFPQIERVHAVLGSAYRHSVIFDIAQQDSRVGIHRDLNESGLIETMKQCQLAVVPSSTILFEICCVRSLVLAGYFVDNQKRIYEGFVDRGAVIPGNNFEHYSPLDFEKKLAAILELESYDSYLDAQCRLFDDQISNRLQGVVESLC